jgi:hypothetical protein
MMAAMSLAALLVLAAAAACQQPAPVAQAPVAQAAPAVRLANPSRLPRDELLRFAMPWPAGRFRELHAVQVGADEAPASTLLRWPDGTVAVSLVHARIALGPREEKVLRVEGLPAAAAGPRHLPELPRFEVELTDAFGRVHRTRLRTDPAAALEAAGSSPRFPVRQLRGVLERDGEGGPEAMFAVQVWAGVQASPPRIELSLLVDADPRSGEVPTGPARFAGIALRVEDPAWEPVARHASELAIPAAVETADGARVLALLGPSRATYLGDRTGKAFLVDLLPVPDPAGASRRTVEQPLEAWPELDWVRATGAFGVHGGPGPVSARRPAPAAGPPSPFWAGPAGGPFGSFDAPRDPVDAGLFGLPPSALHDLLRGAPAPGLRRARLTVLQGLLRPTPGTTARLPEDAADLRSGLSRRAIERPHGFRAFDYEHISADLPFDLYWLTGDPCARHELGRLGSGLLPVLRSAAFRTSRGEGACLRAGVLIARATGDRDLLAALRRHLVDELEPRIGADDPRRMHAIAQPPDPRALDGRQEFDLPWQMGLLVHGLHALWRESGDDLARELALRVARRMAGTCWIDGVGLAGLVSATAAGVRVPAPGDGSGAQGIALGAFVLAAEMTADEADRETFRSRADAMLRSAGREPGDRAWPAAWFALHDDRADRPR